MAEKEKNKWINITALTETKHWYISWLDKHCIFFFLDL